MTSPDHSHLNGFDCSLISFRFQLVPSSLPSSSLVSLDLSRNEIMSIVSSSSLSMVHLRRLDLSGNLLESLSAGSHLRWCPGLRRLDLSNNALGEANLMSMPGELEELYVYIYNNYFVVVDVQNVPVVQYNILV